MERLAHLIGKLKEQFEQNAGPSELLVTTQLIQGELLRQASVVRQQPPASAKVAVVMPAARQAAALAEVAVKQPVKEKQPEPEPEPEPEMATTERNGHSYAPVPTSAKPNGWSFDPLKEIPTLAHQQEVKELNEMMARDEYSLNDKLKASVVEVGHVLTDAPLRDLKKAIGVNDRFVFISELFRGDEVMYERSIKTINGFHIFPEAEYWIERELKVKLGWDETKPTVRHFYQLVKRRFS